jgi:hypothetical protein
MACKLKREITRARTTCQPRNEGQSHLSYDEEHLDMSIKCEEEKNLSVCLHYQLINEITSSIWQMA